MRTIALATATLVLGIAIGTLLHREVSASGSPCPPIGLPSGTHHTVLVVRGGTGAVYTTDSATFRITGPFTLRYQTRLLQRQDGGDIGVTIRNRDESVLNLALNGGMKAGSTVENGVLSDQLDDCSGGCFLHIEALNVGYTLQVER